MSIHALHDDHGRTVRYLRLSLTDRCNLRCLYCHSNARHQCIPHEKVLRYEEMIRLVQIVRGMGVGKVRLTFMNGDTVLSSEFVKTDATELDTPLVSAPEGKVFIGWYRIDKYDNGTTYTMVFDPDENGHVTIPNGTTLEPMTLYALFETPSGTDATEGG